MATKEHAEAFIHITLQGFQATGVQRQQDVDRLRQVLESLRKGEITPDEAMNTANAIYEGSQDFPTQRGRERIH